MTHPDEFPVKLSIVFHFTPLLTEYWMYAISYESSEFHLSKLTLKKFTAAGTGQNLDRIMPIESFCNDPFVPATIEPVTDEVGPYDTKERLTGFQMSSPDIVHCAICGKPVSKSVISPLLEIGAKVRSPFEVRYEVPLD